MKNTTQTQADTCSPYANGSGAYCNLPSFFILYGGLMFFLVLFHYIALIFILKFLSKYFLLKLNENLKRKPNYR